LMLRMALATMAEALRLSAAALAAVMPSTTRKINEVLAHSAAPVWRDELSWGSRLTGNQVATTAILFPRPMESKAETK
jgi:methionyl-tRNA synthetase